MRTAAPPSAGLQLGAIPWITINSTKFSLNEVGTMTEKHTLIWEFATSIGLGRGEGGADPSGATSVACRFTRAAAGVAAEGSLW